MIDPTLKNELCYTVLKYLREIQNDPFLINDKNEEYKLASKKIYDLVNELNNLIRKYGNHTKKTISSSVIGNFNYINEDWAIAIETSCQGSEIIDKYMKLEQELNEVIRCLVQISYQLKNRENKIVTSDQVLLDYKKFRFYLLNEIITDDSFYNKPLKLTRINTMEEQMITLRKSDDKYIVNPFLKGKGQNLNEQELYSLASIGFENQTFITNELYLIEEKYQKIKK